MGENVTMGAFRSGGEPDRITAHHRLGRRLATPHLPQGAPSSRCCRSADRLRLVPADAREAGGRIAEHVRIFSDQPTLLAPQQRDCLLDGLSSALGHSSHH